MISVKATKAEDGSPASSRERYLLKAVSLSRKPLYLAVLLVGFVLYLKTFFPSQAKQRTHEEEPAPAPAEEQGAPAPIELAAIEEDPAPADTEEEDGKPVSSGSAFIEREDPSFVMLDSPSIIYQAPVVAVSARNDAFDIRPRAGNDNLGLASPRGGPSGAGDDHGGGSAGPGNGEDNEDEDDAANRTPRVHGSVYLGDFVSGHAAVIAFAMLLQNASDPDGDRLTISNVSVSSGTLTAVPGGWLYTPTEGMTGFAWLSYTISDGSASMRHTAQFRVVLHHTVEGTTANDILLGTTHMDQIDGRDGDDNIDARAGDDTVWGGGGHDHIMAGLGNDIVFGGAGDDLIVGGAGKDTVWAGAGDDRVFGEEGDDVLFGQDGNDSLSGGADDDTLDGGDGDDELDGGAGSDAVYGGSGADEIAASLDAVSDVYDGGADNDTVDYSSTTMGVIVDLTTGEAVGVEVGADLLTDIENVMAGEGDDVLRGDAEENLLVGAGGDDVLDGGAGADQVQGGAGDDRIVGTSDGEEDVYEGGAGSDTVDYSGTALGVIVDLQTGKAVGVEIGTDLLANIEEIMGGDGDDTFIIAAAPTELHGGDGDDDFHFTALAIGMPPVTHGIHDFAVGDRIHIPGYVISSDAMDDLEDLFEDIYGDDRGGDRDDGPRRHIRYQNDRVDEMERTKIEADLDGDTVYELAISLDGHHVLFIAENIT